MNRKLRRSNTDKVITGVCGGIGETFDIDPTIVRLIWAALCLMGFSGVVLYIIASVIIPAEGDVIGEEEVVDGQDDTQDY